jgi:hypothetical protein
LANLKPWSLSYYDRQIHKIYINFILIILLLQKVTLAIPFLTAVASR